MTTNPFMKAARFHQYGGADVIRYEDAPVPEVTEDEVLIKVAATSFNPFDAKLRSGAFQAFLPIELPFTPSVNVSGTVVKVGDSVTTFREGDNVFAYLDVTRNGAAAEYVVSKAVHIAHAPKTFDLHESAAVPSVALTAWQALFDYGNLQSGQRVLITAAAGGVGTLAVQLAKWKGAYVIGTASEKGFSLLEQLGIDEIIDYKKQSVAEALKSKVDVIFNLSPAGKEELNSLLQLLNEGGTFISAVSPADENMAKELGVKAVRLNSHPDAEKLTQIAELLDAGVLKPIITERTGLSEIAEVHQKFDDGKVSGRVLIIVDGVN
ncbi:NADP-dependent oxidoreductase [Paenibacillus sp. 7124]|uniref:NADP-dependent oxidoreductase n=1 Tax=Paenibacillus apii TaxID=1850370 RepID=A0A6M1PHR5_9BACL|nr:NADP-dependent oxidoreductase [Paenibacillus apii]NGM82726.1 NADP-dependent oxidoreductase [Paenibacillus apii]NJJ39867.1 NADP-dependent oxidoreductase [Paenibacillus apii]